MDKYWKKPKLIVLVKGNPDEMLLDVCRHPNVSTGPTDDYNRCNLYRSDSTTDNIRCRGCFAQPNS